MSGADNEQASEMRKQPAPADLDAPSNQLTDPLIDKEIFETSEIAYLGGTIDISERNTMKRLLFRITRGKAMLQTFPLEVSDRDVLMKDDFHKRRLGYIVLFEDSPTMRRIVTKACQSFLGPVFETTMRSIQEDLRTARAQKEQMRGIIVESKRRFVEYLKDWNPLQGSDGVSVVQVYKQILVREKTIYRTLNMFKECNSLLVGLVWVPAKYES